MRVCDRCRGERGVLSVALTMGVDGRAPAGPGPADLCEDCRTIMAEVVAAAPWRAGDVLRILDGEATPAEREAAAKLPEVEPEIPFERVTPEVADSWAARYRRALEGQNRWGPELVERMTAAYRAGLLGGRGRAEAHSAAVAVMPFATYEDRRDRMTWNAFGLAEAYRGA